MVPIGLLVVALGQSGAALLRDVRAALDHSHIPVTTAAHDMGCHWSLVAKGLAGEKHLSITRLADLPPTFWQWFAVLLASRHGFPKELEIQPRMAKAMLRLKLDDRRQA
jgi:hypothetical protein